MQIIDHKGLCIKCDNMGLFGAIDYSHIYLGNLDFEEQVLCALEVLFILVVHHLWHNGIVDQT